MALINQQPTALGLIGVIGAPFDILVDFVSFTNASGSVAWSEVTAATVVVTDQYGSSISGGIPSVGNPPEDYQLLISWSAAQTTLISNAQSARWALQITVNNIGPETVLAGPLAFYAPTWPGTSTSTTADLSVSIGTATIEVEVFAATASPVILNLDGGTANSVYLSTQVIDGGDA